MVGIIVDDDGIYVVIAVVDVGVFGIVILGVDVVDYDGVVVFLSQVFAFTLLSSVAVVLTLLTLVMLAGMILLVVVPLLLVLVLLLLVVSMLRFVMSSVVCDVVMMSVWSLLC